jgi:5-(carboxyamino)imidazole ribonucleotide synthase
LSKAGISRVGIVGAGQLGRMMALAGYPLGIRCRFLDRSADAPAAQVAPILLGDLQDSAKIQELARSNEVLTFDWENVPAQALQGLRGRTPIRPSVESLSISQDRLQEKALFEELSIPVTPHAAVDSLEDLTRAVAKLGTPGVLKTRRLGYDGKGQLLIKRARNTGKAWEALRGVPLIYEQFMRFSCEVSLVGVRAPSGETAFYPLARNTHQGGILRLTVAPYADAALARSARRHVTRLMETLDYAGVLAVEFFVVDGGLMANEMAPRVHNSGHWTIEGCLTSQFENHLRAICGLPLGSTRALGHAAMVNFIGRMPDRHRLLQIEGLAFHDYGKEPRAARKLGHCTILQSTPAARDRSLALALKRIRWA